MTEYKRQSRSSNDKVAARENLYHLYKESPLPTEDMMINLGLYIRSGALSKIFFLNEIYEKILDIPGCVMEFGTWWGQSLVLFENFRAIHEPYNFTRRIVGFDTFMGYPSVSDKDKSSDTIKVGGYSTSSGYEEYLSRLIDYHESENVMSHIKKHQLIKGDVVHTVPQYFKENPETIVSLAFFDMALYEPTKACLESLVPHLVKGSIVAFDELNCPDYPGETQAVMEVLGLNKHKVFRSKFLPDRVYFVIE